MEVDEKGYDDKMDVIHISIINMNLPHTYRGELEIRCVDCMILLHYMLNDIYPTYNEPLLHHYDCMI